MFADIIINEKAYELDKPFCYHVPDNYADIAIPGKRVIIPFGKYKKTEGIIIKTYEERPDIKNIKSIIDIIDREPIINETGFQIADFIRKKYITTYYEALRLNMPSGIKLTLDERIFIKDDVDIEKYSGEIYEILSALNKYNGIKESDLKEHLNIKDIRRHLCNLEGEGLIEFKINYKSSVNDKTVTIVSISDDRDNVLSYINENKSKKAQLRVLNTLLDNKSITLSDLIMLTKCTRKTVDALAGLGLVELDEAEVIRNPYLNNVHIKEERKEPTKEQEVAIDLIKNGLISKKNDTFLIHGVTGSGKTEVYLQVIEEALKLNRTAIVLVPEISLTPQMVERFFRRFQTGVSVIHSGLSQAERYDQFKLIKKGEIKIVIGARSAIFAPIENVGIIIIDEEHEQSYKSEMNPKYDAIEVAKFRAQKENAILVLSSATPSIVSYYNAKTNKYKLINMENRYNFSKMPHIDIVDMRKELASGNFSPLSERLKEEIRKNIENNEQTILFLNRRGYSTFVSCRSCGFVAKCPECDVSLTYHNNKNKLICHYCGYERGFFVECPECKSKYIKHFGKGTQKIEEEIYNTFKNVTLIRMDADTTYKKYAHEKILNKFEKENINILLGTQMITKGLDFKNVTLSAVLAADGGLFLDDYRSLERTFSQVTQVCGRSGRGDKKGRCIVQTYNPEHFVLSFAKNHDYVGFYETEIILRKQMKFPPFCDIINIVCTSEDEKTAAECIKYLYKLLINYKITLNLSDDDLKIYKPAYAPIAKIKNKFRFRILIKQNNEKDLSFLMERIYGEYHKMYKASKVGLSIDINPVSML